MFFDDFKVTHTKSPIVEAQDFMPFGLTFNQYTRENTLPNRWKFQGQEHIDDLGLNWDSFKWRNHQPDIGRFFNIDPLADKYVYNSPYAFSENKVTAHVELEGLESVTIQRYSVEQEVKKIENVVMPVVNEIKSNLDAMGERIAAAWHSLAPGLGRGGSTWTSKKHNGGDQVKIPPGKSDGGGNVDALIGPTLRSDPATGSMDQFFLGVEMVIAVEEKTQVIENVVSDSEKLTEVKVQEVKDTVLQSKYHNQYEVTLENGRDSIIQTSNIPQNDEED